MLNESDQLRQEKTRPAILKVEKGWIRSSGNEDEDEDEGRDRDDGSGRLYRERSPLARHTARVPIVLLDLLGKNFMSRAV